MWICPKCKEQIEDGFDSCWKCAGAPSQSALQPKAKRPLEQLEFICILLVAMPGILMLTGGRVQNRAQAVFRIAVTVVGLLGYGAIRLYQRKQAGKSK